ncbi:MAG: ABC transporter permease [Bacteroidetes bacterium]|nr:ABC transporter permease [Bacteroidota bacterium]
MKIRALVADTFREIYAKKVIIGIVVIEIVTLVITALILFSGGMQREYREAAQGTNADSASTSGQHPAAPIGSAPYDTSLLGAESAPLPGATLTDSERAAAHAGSSTFRDTAGSRLPIAMHVDGKAMLREKVKGAMAGYAGVFGAISILLGIFMAAGIVSSMMEKGTIDLLLSKPLTRSALLFGRALGGVAAVALNLALFVTALWALYGFASGVWHLPFLAAAIALPLFSFIVTYAGVILLNVYTDGWMLPLSIAYMHTAVLSPFLFSREQTLFSLVSSAALRSVIDGLYYVLPQTADVIKTMSDIIYSGNVSNAMPFVQGTIFAVVCLVWAAWKFQRKDF